MLYTNKNQPKRFLDSGEKYFYVILSFMGMAAIWLIDQNRLTNCQFPIDRRPREKSTEKWSSCFREEDV